MNNQNKESTIQDDLDNLFELKEEEKRNIKNVLGTIIKNSYPASVEWARHHRKISKYGYSINKVKLKGEMKEEQVPICPCCSKQVIIQPISLDYSTWLPSSIQQGDNKFLLSSGICLFFMFVKMCIYFLILRFVISDGYNIYSSISGHYCIQNEDKCTDFFESVLAGYNKHSQQDQDLLKTIDILNLILVILSIAFFTYFRNLFNRVHVFLDMVNVTEDDYSILIEDIPSIIRSKQQGKGQDGNYEEHDLNISIQQYLAELLQKQFHEEILKGSQQHMSKYEELKNELKDRNIESPFIPSVSLCYDTSQFDNLSKIERNIFNELFEDFLSKKEFEQIYMKDFEEAKDKIRKKINNDNTLNFQEKQKMIKRQIFLIQAKKISQIFLNNFRYRIKKNELTKSDQNIPDLNIRKYLIFLNKIDDLYANARKKYVNKNNNHANHSFFIGKAFVTFQYQTIKNIFIEEYEKNPTLFKINNKQLVISQPNEPEDILWENLKVTSEERGQAVLLSILILFMCIGFSFIVTLFAEEMQIKGTNQIKMLEYNGNGTLTNSHHHHLQSIIDVNVNETSQGSNLETSAVAFQGSTLKVGEMLQDKQFSNFFNTFMIILTNLVNILLEVIIKKVTQLERYKSKTQKIETMINRFVISKFVNTCMIYFILYMVNNDVDILSQNGLMNKIIKLVSIGAVIDIFLNISQPGKNLRLLYYTMLYQNISYVNTSQEKLNEQLSCPEFDFVERYSYYIVQIYLVSFYSLLCPVAVPLLIIIFFIQYWIDKINLFKRCSANDSIGFKLSQTTLKLCQSSLVVCTFGNIIFYQVINVYSDFKFTYLNVLAFFLSLGYAILIYKAPQHLKNMTSCSHRFNMNISYNEYYRDNFIESTYWSQNPATCKSSKQSQITPEKINIADDPITNGLQLTYESYNTVDQFSKIFLPCQLKKYWKWNEKYETQTETYGPDDISLFNKCLQINEK